MEESAEELGGNSEWSPESLKKYGDVCLRRFYRIDFVIALAGAVASTITLCNPNYTIEVETIISECLTTLRAFTILLTVLNVSVVPIFTFSGLFWGFFANFFSAEGYEITDTIEFGNSRTKGESMEISELRMLHKRSLEFISCSFLPKAKLFMSIFLSACLVVLSLATVNDFSHLSEYFLATLHFCSCSFGTLIHHIFFPEVRFFETVDRKNPAITPGRHPLLCITSAIYVGFFIFGCSIGNFMSLLDRFELYARFPISTYIGAALGHFFASIAANIVLFVY